MYVMRLALLQVVVCVVFTGIIAQTEPKNIDFQSDGFHAGQVVEFKTYLSFSKKHTIIALRTPRGNGHGLAAAAYIRFIPNQKLIVVVVGKKKNPLEGGRFKPATGRPVYVRLWYTKEGIRIYFNGVRIHTITVPGKIVQVGYAPHSRGRLQLLSENKYLCMSDDNSCGTIASDLPGKPTDICADQRIVGGQLARPGKFPYQVSLRWNMSSTHFCGGVLIDKCWVLTAAHCTRLSTMSYTAYVRVGDYYNGDDATLIDYEDPQNLVIQEVMKHQSYTRNPGYRNDISLIRLKQPCARLGRFVRPACLPTSPTQFPQRNENCVITGWGANKFKQAPSDFKKCLMRAAVPIVPQNTCIRKYGSNKITDTMVCAGGEGSDTCQGDSGGPLSCRGEDDRWYVWGLTSFGDNCGMTFGVYTKVAKFRDWIRLKMSNSCGMTSRELWTS